MMRFFSEALNYSATKVVLAAFVIVLIAANPLTRKTVIQVLIAVGIANGMTDLWKAFWPMARPFQEMHVNMWVGTSPSHGTASAHSANMAAVAFVFVYHLKWWGTPWIAIALIVGYSRVFCGAHYPYQVLLGWVSGLLAAFLVCKGWDLYLVKKQKAIPDPVS